MKLIIRVCTLIGLVLSLNSARASRVIIYYENGVLSNAQSVRDIFTKKYNMPSSLIELQMTNECREEKTRFLEICIDKKGELKVLSSFYTDKVESFQIFSKDL